MFKREKEMMFFGLNADQKSYEGLRLFLFIYIGACLFAATLTAPTYWLVQYIDSINSTETTQWLLGKRIDIFYNRLCYAATIIALPYMMKRCGLFSIKNLGLTFDRFAAINFAKFFGIGLAISIVIFSLQYIFCDVTISPSFSSAKLLKILLNAILGGLVVGLLEEIIMRGLIMRAIYTAWGAIAGITLSSLFFAYKHFGVPKSIWHSLPGGSHNSFWDIGFIVAWFDTIGISANFKLIPFFSLTMFGAVLSLLYIRTKSLWPPIAFHAGIVFTMQSYRKIFQITDSEYTKYFGGSGMTNGYIALILLSIIFVLLCFWRPKKDENK